MRSSRAALIKAQSGKTISLFQADRLCCSIGLHPWHVYGDLYFKDIWEKDEQAKTERH
jgi:Tat protein secretion system quality control protein TatD with DNase activity